MDEIDARTDGAMSPRTEDAPQLIDQLRVMMLRRMVLMMTTLPQGAYTECRVDLANAPGGGTFKLRDLAAALKDLAAIGGKAPGVPGGDPGVESWAPLAGIFDPSDDTTN